MTTSKPRAIFGRSVEWDELAAFVDRRPVPGVSLAVVWGRRRMGKSYLLRHLVRRVGGFYYQALDQEPVPALRRLGRNFAEYLKLPGGAAFDFADWEQALAALCGPAYEGEASPRLVVLDEFPYLTRTSAELPSIVQAVVDSSADDPAAHPVRLILCGSALSVMTELLAGTGALRGRARMELALGPFAFRDTARFWGVERKPRLALLIDAVVNGTPGYRDLLDGIDRPTRPEDFDEWITAGVLNPTNAMFREDETLLGEERALADRALYQSVLGAIASGAHTQKEIGGRVGRTATQLRHPLMELERVGFVLRIDDAFRSNRPRYQIADPIVRFHHVVTRPDLARFEARETSRAWAGAATRFESGVLGPHFEQLAREWTFRHASAATIGGQLSHVAPATISDPKARRQHDIDVVAIERGGRRRATIRMIGEAKHTAGPRNLGDLRRLEHLRDLLVQQRNDYDTGEIRLAIYAGHGGADRELTAVARNRSDVELVDLNRLYTGD